MALCLTGINLYGYTLLCFSHKKTIIYKFLFSELSQQNVVFKTSICFSSLSIIFRDSPNLCAPNMPTILKQETRSISSPHQRYKLTWISSISWNKYRYGRYWFDSILKRYSKKKKKKKKKKKHSLSGFLGDRCFQKQNNVRSEKKMATAYSWPDLTMTHFLTPLFAIISVSLRVARSGGQSVELILWDLLLNITNMSPRNSGLELKVYFG